MRIVYRQLQEIPFEKWMQEIELERHTDENEGSLGHPLPKRYRMFSGGEHSQIRVHIRAYDNFEHYGELFEAFMEDETGQKDEVFDTISTIGKERNFISSMIRLM
jgi:hypothetical protein